MLCVWNDGDVAFNFMIMVILLLIHNQIVFVIFDSVLASSAAF